ncbi:Na+/proline symporter [Oculatella sp. LEGE 06141]|uniref:sodium:solute symporter family transporter n=1 Tax=Oculatella sp. LEGE 06141 TaxID=1828648 RepID=UPI0018828D7C|nr:Na+/proline symporter [Oculatella sp. LEGE 06141]MBE9178384.1 Na+/proline symporter [Oculatella sp. LEGE 06141]
MSIGAIALLVTLVTAGVFALLGFLHTSKRTINLEEYVVSRNRYGSWMAFSTIVASALGAWILFSLPEVGATSGIAGIVGYCIGQAAPSAVFAKIGSRIRYLMPNGHSLNEYVLHRFGNAMYVLTLTIIVFYMFIYLAAELTAIAKAVQLMADVPLGWTALVVITATFIYTTYGGLGATIFTDAIQFTVIVPLLLISLGVAVMALGGISSALAPVRLNAPELLSFSNGPGIKFGATLVIAVLVAEIFNQSNWQRVYACRTNGTVKRAFLGSAIAILPMLFVAGLLGVLASQFGFADDRAFFSLIQQLALPVWFTIVVLVLALALVMSSLDTLLNGIASVFTLDLTRLFPSMQTAGLLRASRVITVAIGIPAVLIAAQGYNVLYLFLLADLVCAGVFVPILYGLYSRRLTGRVAVISSLVGIASGALFFPKTDYSPWLGIPFGGDLLVSFVAPVVVSTAIILGWNLVAARIGTVHYFDFDRLRTEIHSYDGLDEAAIAHIKE